MPKAKTARNGSSLSKSPAAVSETTVTPEGQSNGNSIDLESEIRRRAYELYEERGRTPGHESDDWVVAEREIVARYNHQGV
jgi:hypothetical protein